MKQILDNLKINPIFCLSLAAKELFHSNFLEWLFNKDAGKFIAMVDDLAGTGLAGNNPQGGYHIYREKNSFDICITHKEKSKQGKEKEVYDLVLENKVKSIPYKEQLNRYVDDIKKAKQENVMFILLSLANNFPQKEEIEREGKWKIINYDTLREKIESHYGNSNIYINDYCKFIECLHKLQEIALKNEDEHIFARAEELKPYRLHDMYIKQRCSSFMQKLHNSITQQSTDFKNIPVYLLDKYEDVRKQKGIYLQSTMNRGNGTVNIFINSGEGDNDYVYEIVIQGGQYRHGINSLLYNNNLNIMWKNIKDNSFINDFNESNKFYSRYRLSKAECRNDFNHYGQGYIYRYLKTDGLSFKDLFDLTLNDVKQFIQKKYN